MADSKISALASHGAPVAADYVASVLASGPTSKKLLMSDLIKYAGQWFCPGGRLTLESGVPVSTTDQTAKTSIYYTPYVHNIINLWDGSNWVPTEFTEKTLALGTITAAKPYDVFGYLSAGALVLELLAWTNDTTRATAVTLQDGRYCKSGDKTRLLLGTFYTTATTTTEDSAAKRYLWNAYNRVVKTLVKKYGTAGSSWSYTTGAWQAVNADTTTPCRVNVICGVSSSGTVSLVCAEMAALSIGSGGSIFATSGIAINATNTNDSQAHGRFGHNSTLGGAGSSLQVPLGGNLSHMPAAGMTYYQQVEYAEIGGTGTVTFYNEDATANRYGTGLVGSWQC